MTTWWLSWWDPVDGKAGKNVDGIVVWISGSRSVDDDQSENACCALVVAKTEQEAWRKADTYYPGAASAERRFAHDRGLGFRPGDRFPMTQKQERMITAAEAGD